MTAAVSRQDDTGLLMELLAPRSGPDSPQVRRSGSFRRSRNSPSTSPSVAAERELSAFLGMTTLGSKISPGREPKLSSPSAQPPETRPQGPRTFSSAIVPSQQEQRGVAALWTGPRTANRATSSYLSNDSVSPSDVDPTTSNANQQSDHNNNGDDLADRGQIQPAESRLTDGLGQDVGGETGGKELERSGATAAGSMSVVLEKCSLVPQLRVFDIIGESPHSRGRLHGPQQDHLVVTDLEEPVERVRKEQNNNAEGCDEQVLRKAEEEGEGHEEGEERETGEEGEGREDKVIVWCVTGVCEMAADLSHSDSSEAHTGHHQGAASRTPPDPPAKEGVAPTPISNQPVPSASHFDHASHPASSPGQCSAEPASDPDDGSRPTAGASSAEAADRGSSTRRSREGAAARERSAVPGSRASSSSRGAKSSASPRTIKESPISKTQQAGTKTANSASAGTKSRLVRTLTTSENQGMRRVVPISRPGRAAPAQGRPLEKPLGSHRGSSSTTITSSTTSTSASQRRGERPSTAPSSRRSSFNKVSDATESKEPKASGVRPHNQDLRKTSLRKPSAKVVAKPEEKMCRSTLRALTLGGAGGGSASAPATPMHRAAAAASSLPGFARSTASFSFRRTQTVLSASRAASDSSGKALPPKTTTTPSSSAAPPGRSRAGSLKVSHSSHFQNSSSSPGPNSRAQSSWAPAQSPHPDLLVTPKGHRRNDSSTLSDKSSNSRESAKFVKPGWR